MALTWYTGSLENLSQGCKKGYPVPCNGYSLSLVLPFFEFFINIHEYANAIIFIHAQIINKYVRHNITGSITKWHNGSLGLKLVKLWIFNDFMSF